MAEIPVTHTESGVYHRDVALAQQPLSLDTSAALSPVMSSTSSHMFAAPSSAPVTPTTPAASSAGLQKRRSSTRSIKRKKFDDELVESSLAKTDRTSRPKPLALPSPGAGPAETKSPAELVAVTVGPASISPATTGPAAPTPFASPVTTATAAVSLATTATVGSATATVAISSSCSSSNSSIINTIIPTTVTQPVPHVTEKKKSKPSSKRSKKSKPPPAASTKDLGRWKPQDDLALINAVQQTCDLTAVYLGVKFSCKFTVKEIQERWYALLYDPVLSKLAIQAIKMLHPDIVATTNSRALFSKEEEVFLGKTVSTSQPTLEVFLDLIVKNPEVFHASRTAKALYTHWLLMKQYHLLPDQSVQPMPRGDHVLNFSDAEDMINDEDLKDPKDDQVDHEMAVSDRRQKQEIRHLEQELPKWQVLVDSVTGISPPDFDNQTLAVLRGRLVRYLMRSREITLGRATKENQIDVDLSLEGPAWKISRRQGLIKLKNNGDFYIANEGSRPVYIDGKPVLMGNKQKLNNNSVVEISCLRFIFLINTDLIGIIRQESQKVS